MDNSGAQDVNAVIRAAWAITIALGGMEDAVAHRDLVTSVQDVADRRTSAALSECAARFETVAEWIRTTDPGLSVRAAAVAGRMQRLAL